MKISESLYQKACTLMPGGVNSPVRAFGSVGGTPPFIAHASGARITDEDGVSRIDFVGSWGPVILGHAHPRVIEAVCEAARRGLSYGAPHRGEIALAERIREAMPHLEMIRLVSSGTEAAMSALRLARGATGREGVIKFRGCYHGHADSFLIAAGSGALTFGNPSSPGVTRGAAGDTLLAEYNDLESVSALFREHGTKIACVILEPVCGNMGVITPATGFLEGVRSLCTDHGALLLFDEVITGFRVGFGGAAERFGVTPDLTVLGKIIGGGMPVGAYGGSEALMSQIAPLGPVYQAGTLSGNPVATAAGLATLTLLKEENPYPQLETLAVRLAKGTKENLQESGLTWTQNRIASMSTLFFGIDRAENYEDITLADTALFARYHAGMLAEGIYLAPSQFEATFLSAAHGEKEVDSLLEAQRRVLKNIAR